MKKGFSLIVLMVVVIVLIVITTATTIGVSNAQKNVKVLNFATELSIIQDKVDLYHKQNNRYPIVTSSGDYVINDISLKQLDLKEIFDSEENSKTDELHSLNYGLNPYDNNGNADDIYLISSTPGQVYYKAGIYEYYTLTDELKQKIGYIEPNKDDNLNVSGIIFIKNDNNYTNQSIVTTIKIPVDYQNISCKLYSSSLNGTEISNFTTNGNYKEYTTPNDINSNYSLVVTCSNNGENIVATYSVDNFDGTDPVVEIVGGSTNNKNITNNITGEENNFYYINYYDNESGIKDIKYAELKIDGGIAIIRDYMNLYGKEIKGNVINYKKGTRWITIYLNDVAGNEISTYVQVPSEE